MEMLGVGVGGAVVMIVLAPLFDGVLGFVFGLIMALLYNLAARFSGGIRFET